MIQVHAAKYGIRQLLREITEANGANVRWPALMPASVRAGLEAATGASSAPPPPGTKPSQSTAEFVVGTRAEGNFEGGGEWYPGVIVAVHRARGYGMTYDLEYDDGDQETQVPAAHVRSIEEGVPAANGCMESSDGKSDDDSSVNVEEVGCSICGSLESTEENDVLLCDRTGCFRAFHMHCLNPAVTRAGMIANNLAKAKRRDALAAGCESASRAHADQDDEESDEDDNDVDDTWFCPQCDCLQECLDNIRDALGGGPATNAKESWEKVFPEAKLPPPEPDGEQPSNPSAVAAAAAAAAINGDDDDSSDSDDSDFDPDGAEAAENVEDVPSDIEDGSGKDVTMSSDEDSGSGDDLGSLHASELDELSDVAR